MINEEDIKVLKKYVNEQFFDMDKLINYLMLHDMVGIEIFAFIENVTEDAKKRYGIKESILPLYMRGWNKYKDDPEQYRELYTFMPISVEEFIARVPFLFYMPEETVYVDPDTNEEYAYDMKLAFSDFAYSIGEPFDPLGSHRREWLTTEAAFKTLKYLFYEKGYSLDDIFGYPDKVGKDFGNDIFGDWFDYIDMCLEVGSDNLMPLNFFYNYNLLREKLNIEPILFPIQEWDYEVWEREDDKVQYMKRKGNMVKFHGDFPCDDNGEPVFRWIGIDIKDAKEITCERKRDFGFDCIMTVILTPKTVIHAQLIPRDEIGNYLEGAAPGWHQMYAGPQCMSFNYSLLKKRRTELGYTQQEVADAVQSNVRTYQKWESGETKPDGYYLLRIMNWLDIPDINDVIIYEQ